MSRTLPTVEDFNAIADEDTGLVPMRILLPTITEKVGEVRGYIPVTALQFYLVGTAEPLKGFKSAEAKRLHRERIESEGRAPAATEEDEDEQELELSIEGFRGLHHLELVRLAKAVSGQTGNMKKDDALAILEAEERRREEAAAATAQGAPGGTVTGAAATGGAAGGVSTANLGLGVETGRNSGAQTGGTGPAGGQNGNTGTTTA